MNDLSRPPIPAPRHESMRIAGERVSSERRLEVRNPWNDALVGTVPKASVDDIRRAFSIARAYKPTLTRYQRYAICYKTAELIRSRTDELAALITAECGICLKDSRYEVGRACDVFTFAGNAALADDGQVFSCDLTPHGKSRKVYTLREPLLGAISAITPFNHPLNQVAHKIAPSVATNNRMVLKPTEKTPLAALVLADILYEAGLPPPMFSVVTGDPREIADEMLTNPDVDLVTFTGGVPVGKYIAANAFVEKLVARTRAWTFGDPMNPEVDMGTVIDAQAATGFEAKVNDALARGARLLAGNQREGALYSPTVLDAVAPEMDVVRTETFGPVSPVIRFKDVDDAIRISNSTAYGLSSSVCTNRLDVITRFVSGLNVGSVNIREE